MTPDSALRERILALVKDYAGELDRPSAFIPGKTVVPVSGKVVGGPELASVVDAALDGWFTTGRSNDAFEQRLSTVLGAPHVLTANSGSSANLLAVSALCSPALGERALRPGDEVITVAAAFPTTVNPLLLYGLRPVFVDVGLPTCNIDPDLIEAAIGDRTRAIMLVHTLGNPFDLAAVRRIADKHGFWLIEDCCDALGSIYDGRMVGSFGDIGTLSFYPAHQLTMGEGGAVFTTDPLLARELESIRDWGRACYCAPGRDNTCGKRFSWQLGGLPYGYDHKYSYTNLGFNLKITDMQAALGLAQLDRLAGFVAKRRENFHYLRERLAPLEEFLILPEATRNADPSWFGFLMTLKPEAATTRRDLLQYLDQQRIGTRLLFAGNLVRQPYFVGRRDYRVSGILSTTDRVMNDSFWVGVWPGLDQPHLDHLADRMGEYFGVGF